MSFGTRPGRRSESRRTPSSEDGVREIGSRSARVQTHAPETHYVRRSEFPGAYMRRGHALNSHADAMGHTREPAFHKTGFGRVSRDARSEFQDTPRDGVVSPGEPRLLKTGFGRVSRDARSEFRDAPGTA